MKVFSNIVFLLQEGIRLSPHHEPSFLAPMTSVNNRREGRETKKKNSPRTGTILLGLPPLPPLVDVIGAGKLGSWCGLSLSY